MQSISFNCAYYSDKSLAIVSPTGSGKTVIAEIAILRALNRKVGVIFYIAPIHVILKQKYEQLTR